MGQVSESNKIWVTAIWMCYVDNRKYGFEGYCLIFGNPTIWVEASLVLGNSIYELEKLTLAKWDLCK